MRTRIAVVVLAAGLAGAGGPSHQSAAQSPPALSEPAATRGATIYKTQCAACHESAATRAPDRETLRRMTRDTILASLVSGTMSVLAMDLSAADKRAVAEYLAGTSSPAVSTGLCANAAAPLGDPLAGPHWIGWGADPANTRFQSQKDAGIRAEDVPRLKLKWAFGFPDATQASAQPSIAAGRVFVGSQKGVVYALDAATGCAHWSFRAAAGVRTAIAVGRTSRPARRAPRCSSATFRHMSTRSMRQPARSSGRRRSTIILLRE